METKIFKRTGKGKIVTYQNGKLIKVEVDPDYDPDFGKEYFHLYKWKEYSDVEFITKLLEFLSTYNMILESMKYSTSELEKYVYNRYIEVKEKIKQIK